MQNSDDNSDDNYTICEICNEEICNEHIIGCCSIENCKIENMCDDCGTWDDDIEDWLCEKHSSIKSIP